jgi:hypothetical protein
MTEMSDVVAARSSSLQSSLEHRRLLRFFDAAFTMVAIAAAIALFAQALAIWGNRALRDDVTHYGWGNVPEENLAILSFLDRYGLIFNYLPSIFFCLGFLIAMGYARRIAQAAGVRFGYSYGWTVGTLFIPLLNLVRPWLGFAEIRRAVLATAREGCPTTGGQISLLTLLLGLTIAFNLGLNEVLDEGLKRFAAPETADAFYPYMDQIDQAQVLGAVGQAGVIFVAIVYLTTIRTAAAAIVSGDRRQPSA